MSLRLHHVGLVVPDLAAALTAYRSIPGAQISEPFHVPVRNYRMAYVTLDNSLIELTQPLDDKSYAARFLALNPTGGLNHLAFEVENLEEARDSLLQQGARPFGSTEPAPDRDGTRIVVLDAAATHGTLVELREARPTAGD
ncbi:VOC family protein [Oceanibacterium hippocampi]|uniref:VOC family protein n=1 Tax=Oceanibacterium hippocampi TaxID=745714 RepID=UPI000A26BC0E|nr:VOC family protein [Oceanibacterium hippocampi]